MIELAARNGKDPISSWHLGKYLRMNRPEECDAYIHPINNGLNHVFHAYQSLK